MPNQSKPFLSIIVPIYNEEATLPILLGKLPIALQDVPYPVEVICIDDGSRDQSQKKLLEVLGNPDFSLTVIASSHVENAGKGAALRTGFAQARGQYVIIQDADLEYDPSEIPKILNLITQQQSPDSLAVFGTRYRDRDRRWIKKHRNAMTIAYWGGQTLTWWTNLLLGTNLTDVLTCYKCFPREFLATTEFSEDGFAWELEVTIKAKKSGLQIIETPIAYEPRPQKEGKKFRWLEGVLVFPRSLRYLFWSPKN
jgi:dolichol-phosphate mannosyltransferase